MAKTQSQNKQSDDVITINLQDFFTPMSVAVLLASIIIVVGMLASTLILSNNLNNIGVTGSDSAPNGGTNANAGNNNPQPSPQQPQQPETATVSVDDDPVKGNLDKAEVVVVEFSDYECPFCKRYFNDTYGKLVEEYVSQENVALVFRDLPLSIHEPGASREANAAECVRDQLDDEAYFEMHNYIFNNTPGNGPGIPVEDLASYGAELGANKEELTSCIEEQKFQDEIDADMQAANSVGITGTPGFVVGTLDENGDVTGDIITGAQPYANFQSTIDKYLEK